MKYGIYTHPKRPKVPAKKIMDHVRAAGFSHSQKDPDIAIVVGGDGTFGYYGKILSVPLLFVGVRQPEPLGSRARLAEITYDELGKALRAIENGKFRILEKRMLSIGVNGRYTDVLTDVYLERGKSAGCLRYETRVKSTKHHKSSFSDYAIGNGVIVSSSFGSGGYFSYLDRLMPGKKSRIVATDFADDRIGICHIIPAYLARKRNHIVSESHKLRYTVPARSTIQIRLVRDARARLYGTTLQSKGIPIRLGDTIAVASSRRTARIVTLEN